MRWAEDAPSSSDAPGFGVIGFGSMARALVDPLLEQGRLSASRLRAVVASEASARQLSSRYGCEVSVSGQEAWRCPIVLLAVKPQQLEAAAAAAVQPGDGVGDGEDPPPLLISVLAGIRLDRLEALFPRHRCVRAVPNTPCLVGAGLTGLSLGRGVTAEQRQEVLGLFAAVGEVLELPEGQLDAFLALTSSGPAFLALVSEALADGAVAAGLPRSLAAHLAHRTLAGTAELLRAKELHPGQLKDMVASPAGTTVAGLRELERAGTRSALIEAVLAAAERSRGLG
jgi:pyrroline-5-carboxylate reductase